MSEMPEPMFNHDLDVFAVADYLISLDALRSEPDVTPLKLAKLLYLAQANYLASTGQRMFSEPVEAFEHGPVVYREWKRHPGSQIIAIRSDPMAGVSVRPAGHHRLPGCSVGEVRGRVSLSPPQKTHPRAGAVEGQLLRGRAPDRIPDEDMAAYFRDHVPPAARVFHPSVVVIPEDFLADEDAEAFAAAVAEYTGP